MSGTADRPPRESARVARAWQVLETVLDPELPPLSVRDLGMVREVRESAGTLEIALTPTYSGCPATEVIERSVSDAINAAGLGPVRVIRRLAPPWTSDWITDEGRRKLYEQGIAPPGPVRGNARAALVPELSQTHGAASSRVEPNASGCPTRLAADPLEAVKCPRCGTGDAELLSAFSSTACKALYRCVACREPFEHIKPI